MCGRWGCRAFFWDIPRTIPTLPKASIDAEGFVSFPPKVSKVTASNNLHPEGNFSQLSFRHQTRFESISIFCPAQGTHQTHTHTHTFTTHVRDMTGKLAAANGTKMIRNPMRKANHAHVEECHGGCLQEAEKEGTSSFKTFSLAVTLSPPMLVNLRVKQIVLPFPPIQPRFAVEHFGKMRTIT